MPTYRFVDEDLTTSVFLVSYDLNKPRHQYEELYRVLGSFDRARLSESCYTIYTNKTPDTLLQMFRRCMDANDTIYIAALTVPYTGFGPTEVNEWLSHRLS